MRNFYGSCNKNLCCYNNERSNVNKRRRQQEQQQGQVIGHANGKMGVICTIHQRISQCDFYGECSSISNSKYEEMTLISHHGAKNVLEEEEMEVEVKEAFYSCCSVSTGRQRQEQDGRLSQTKTTRTRRRIRWIRRRQNTSSYFLSPFYSLLSSSLSMMRKMFIPASISTVITELLHRFLMLSPTVFLLGLCLMSHGGNSGSGILLQVSAYSTISSLITHPNSHALLEKKGPSPQLPTLFTPARRSLFFPSSTFARMAIKTTSTTTKLCATTATAATNDAMTLDYSIDLDAYANAIKEVSKLNNGGYNVNLKRGGGIGVRKDEAEQYRHRRLPNNRPRSVPGATGRNSARKQTEMAMEAARLAAAARASVASSSSAAAGSATLVRPPRGATESFDSSSPAASTSLASSSLLSQSSPPSSSSVISLSSPPSSSSVISMAAAGTQQVVVEATPLSTALPRRVKKITTATLPTAVDDTSSSTSSTAVLPKRKKRGRPRKKKIIEEEVGEGDGTMMMDGIAAATTTKAGRGQLNVLAPNADTSSNNRTKSTIIDDDGITKTKVRCTKRSDKLDLKKFYETKLLSSDEEYILGSQVQFMMKCEEVHAGLCKVLKRLPSLEEWASACGFTTTSPTERKYNEEFESSIRPMGSDNVFRTKEELDRESKMFMGNVGLGVQGPGRGKSRQKSNAIRTSLKYTEAQVEAIFGAYRIDGGEGGGYDNEPSLRNRNKDKSCGTTQEFINLLQKSKRAKQEMVQCNMRLVVSIARRYHTVEGVSVQDLVQEGSTGLMRATEKFDPNKGFKFSTYASWWIQQAIFRAMAYHSRNIRLPVHVHNLLSRIRRIRRSLQYELGRPPTISELAMEVDMSPDKLTKLLKLTRRCISMDMPKYKNNPKDLGHSSEESVGDCVDNKNKAGVVGGGGLPVIDSNSPESNVDYNLFQDDLKEMLKVLDEDERTVICLRYGLGNTSGLTRTVTNVAQVMKRTKSWVRSQECRALRKLRRPWYEKRLREHSNSLTG